jgi:hypothetical protein
MDEFLHAIHPRNLLALDHPEKHLTPKQFAVALVVIALSSIFWWYVTGSKIVLFALCGHQLGSTWRSPAALERFWPRVVVVSVSSAICTGFLLLLMGVGAIR